MRTKIYKRNLFTQIRSVNGKFYVIHGNEVYLMDGIGKEIWDIINGKLSVQEIVEQFSVQYDIDQQSLIKDIEKYINHLLDLKLIEEKQAL